MKVKLIIFSAPSGAGKTTIVNRMLAKDLGLEFSISATSRKPRGKEQHGSRYYFLTEEENSRNKIAADALSNTKKFILVAFMEHFAAK